VRDGGGLVADVFVDEWARVVATVARDFGDLELAEDCAQEAFEVATRRWEVEGRPPSPGAWLVTVARRRAIDVLRRDRRFEARLPALARARERAASPSPLVDDRLALLVSCCHPALGVDARVALTLKLVGGLTVTQIARAFVVSPTAMARRLSRARAKIRRATIRIEAPDHDILIGRIAAVRSVIYLIFTQGHTATAATELVRGDLCDEARWLAGLLVELVPGDPENLGLAALIDLTDARRPERMGPDGHLRLLGDHDRSRWNRPMIDSGLALLGRAHAHGCPGPFQLRAAVAALHSTAPSLEATDWGAIVGLYDAMLEGCSDPTGDPDPVLVLNRLVARSRIAPVSEVLVELEALASDGRLDRYPYLHSARAELLLRLGRRREAVRWFGRALELTENPVEAAHLSERIATVGEEPAGPTAEGGAGPDSV